jgi:hypothetical protein
VGKNGRMRVNDATNILGSAYITDSCWKITAGLWKDARNATCLFRRDNAFSTNRFGKPSSKVLYSETL